MALLDEERNMKIILYRLCRGLLASEKRALCSSLLITHNAVSSPAEKPDDFFCESSRCWVEMMKNHVDRITNCYTRVWGAIKGSWSAKKQSCIRNHNQKALSRCKLPGLSIYERSRSEVVELVSQISRQLRIWQFIEHQQKFSWSNRSRQEKYWLLRCC